TQPTILRLASLTPPAVSGRYSIPAGNELPCQVRMRASREEPDMKLGWRLTLAIAGLAWLFAFAHGVEAQNRKAGEAFKNVTTSTLKELSVDDFIASMGLISANLELDCADCHPGAGSDRADFVVDTPRKQTTRRMVEM